jgi:hypothetical protein
MIYRLFVTTGISGFGIWMHILSIAISGCLGVGSFLIINEIDNYSIIKTSEIVQVTDSIPDKVLRDTIFIESPMPVCHTDSFIVKGDTLYLEMSINPKFISKEHE